MGSVGFRPFDQALIVNQNILSNGNEIRRDSGTIKMDTNQRGFNESALDLREAVLDTDKRSSRFSPWARNSMTVEQIPQWAPHKTASETRPYIILSPVSNQACWNRSEDLGEVLSRRIIP